MDINTGTHYKSDIDINNLNESRSINFSLIEPNTRILDVGCACGDLGRILNTYKNCTCYGLEYLEESVNIAKMSRAYKDVYQCDLNNFNIENYPDLKQGFDHIICGDILEHLYNPQDLLLKLSSLLNDNGTFIISIPNISHVSVKFSLLQNQFEYADYGILDRTHIRFYTLKSFLTILQKLNLNIETFNYTVQNMYWKTTKSILKKIPLNTRLYVINNNESYCFQYIFKLSKISKSNETNHVININSLIKNAANYKLLKNTRCSDFLDCFGFSRRHK